MKSSHLLKKHFFEICSTHKFTKQVNVHSILKVFSRRIQLFIPFNNSSKNISSSILSPNSQSFFKHTNHTHQFFPFFSIKRSFFEVIQFVIATDHSNIVLKSKRSLKIRNSESCNSIIYLISSVYFCCRERLMGTLLP